MITFRTLLIPTLALLMLGCSSEPDPTKDILVELPKDAPIWAPIIKIQAQARTPDETTLKIILSAETSEVKGFYDSKYAAWEQLTDWSTSGHDVVKDGGEWKSWKRDDTYFVVGLKTTTSPEMMVTHHFGNETFYNFKVK